MFLLIVMQVAWVSCGDVAVQDLLSAGLSPAALLGVGVPGTRPADAHDRNQSVTYGDLSHALGTMLYHRSMMNEYLCHNYVADEILTELRPLESRSEETPVEAGASTLGGGVLRDHLLADPGSSGYKDWLESSAKMEDMYGQADPKGSYQEGFETGDVTGFATVQGGKGNYKLGGGGDGVDWSSGGGSTGWDTGGGEGWSVGGGGWSGSGGGWSGGGGGWSGGSGWTEGGLQGWSDNSGLALKDLFDLALTALAFLAFKIFALQLILACFAKTPHMTMVLSVTTTAATAEARAKRETTRLNELAYRVLKSIDALMETQSQDNRCLQYWLCDNNKYSRALNSNNRLWLPVWSLGMSWVSGLWHSGGSRIDNIRASVLGLGNANCSANYPGCDRRKG